MNEKMIRDAFENLNPNDIQRQRVYEKIAGIESVSKKPRRALKIVLVAAVITASLAGSVIGIDAVNGGHIMKSVQSFFAGYDVKGHTATLNSTNTGIYAPEIDYIDNDTMIFHSTRGVIVTDRVSKKITQSVDLQAIDCNYIDFGGLNDDNELQTHILADKKRIRIFNTKFTGENSAREISGKGYSYKVAVQSGKKQSPEETGDRGTLQKWYDEWLEGRKNYVETDDDLLELITGGSYKYYDTGSYSYLSLLWNSDGKSLKSFITVADDNEIVLRTVNGKKLSGEKYTVMSAKDYEKYIKSLELPEFKYTGNDGKIRAICEYAQKHDVAMYDRIKKNQVWLPSFYIAGTVKEGGEIKVYGDFFSNVFVRNGNMLENFAGGSNIACYHLLKSGKGYKVVKEEKSGEGAELYPSIERMTAGYPDICRRLKNASNTGENLEYIRMYVQDNNLDIRYIKNYGWNPVPLFEEE